MSLDAIEGGRCLVNCDLEAPVIGEGIVENLEGVASHVHFVNLHQRVLKRCHLSWLTNSVLVYESKCGGREGVAGSQPMSTAMYIT